MTQAELYKELNYVNHSRENRDYYASMLLNDATLMRPLLEIQFMVDDPLSARAGWVVESVVKKDVVSILPHLDYFTSQIHLVYQDQALRPVTKMCETLILSYYKLQEVQTKKLLQTKHKEQIIEAGFDWLITDQKVAVKAYTLTSLYYLGTEFDWIHPELLRIIERDYATSSAAFKARSRHVSGWIKKFNTS